MIYGIGTDIVDVARIERAWTRHGQRFAEKILGEQELQVFAERQAQAALRGVRYLATRFAAKEAFSKAIGTGVRWPMTLQNMQTLPAEHGRPAVFVSGSLQEWMAARGLRAHISLSDEIGQVVAFAIVEQDVAACGGDSAASSI